MPGTKLIKKYLIRPGPGILRESRDRPVGESLLLPIAAVEDQSTSCRGRSQVIKILTDDRRIHFLKGCHVQRQIHGASANEGVVLGA